ncbi:MAG: SpaA isopeptide-forming pilin-related protein [Candidatus Methanoperedens sp.]|nr:SpaA isopeptide-forming pilin-related protein [Candidatus Methanoperedens sp.]
MKGIKGIVLLMAMALVAATVAPAIAAVYKQDGTVYNPLIAKSVVGAASTSSGTCGPIDLAVVLDDTGTMGGAISNIVSELPSITSAVDSASGGDVNIGFVTFRDTVEVKEPLTPKSLGGETTFSSLISSEFASGGGDLAEPSDEAKNTVTHNLGPTPRADAKGFMGAQIGNFSTPWRSGALKLAVLITDAPSNGFSELASGGYPLGDPAYVTQMATLGSDSAGLGIKWFDVFVPDEGDYAGQEESMATDASNSGGALFVTAVDGTGTSDALTSILSTCGKPKATTGSISGMNWEDLNANGTKDIGEPGLANWTITLTNQTGNTVNIVTDANGNYSFTNLSDGNYTVGEILKPGWIQTAPAVSATGSATYTVNISGGNQVVGEDFGNFRDQPPVGSISGMKFNDLNANGIKDPNETGIAGWNITINGTDTITGESVNITTTTDANGSYWFMNLTAGTYVISEKSKCKLKDDDTEDDHKKKDIEHNNDHNVKDNDHNNDNKKKSRVCWVQTWPATGNYTVIITSGSIITGLDFGNFKKGKITGEGDIPANGKKATFRLDAQYPDDKATAQGNVEYQDQAKKLKIKSIQINTVATTMDGKKGVITGLARVNDAGSYYFEVYVEDNGEHGKGVDMFRISLPTYPYSNGAVLSGENIQIDR